MKTFQLQNADLVLSNHNLVTLSGKDALKQKLEHRISLYVGEFLLEPEIGIDWFSLFSLKNPFDTIKAAITGEISSEKEVLSITSLTVGKTPPAKISPNPLETRRAYVEYRCETVYGQIAGNV